MIEDIRDRTPSMYSLNGKLHRSNGPAWMNSRSGHTPPGFYWHWRLFGARQRYYGPQCTNGEWWIHGSRIK